jgi:hypothetical protein
VGRVYFLLIFKQGGQPFPHCFALLCCHFTSIGCRSGS